MQKVPPEKCKPNFPLLLIHSAKKKQKYKDKRRKDQHWNVRNNNHKASIDSGRFRLAEPGELKLRSAIALTGGIIVRERRTFPPSRAGIVGIAIRQRTTTPVQIPDLLRQSSCASKSPEAGFCQYASPCNRWSLQGASDQTLVKVFASF